jgi:DNA primase
VDPVEEIKSRLPIEDLVGQYVNLKRSGSSLKGLCPFHQEKTPSFYVTPSRGMYHCYGCGKGGDVFSFIMDTERLQFREALERLAEQTGVRLPEREQARPSLKGKLFEANEAAAQFFSEQLRGDAGRRAREYLTGRRFGEDAIRLFTLGFAPDGREGLLAHLKKAGYEDRILLSAGLVLQDDVAGRLRDRFRGRLMFPIRDASGRISGFGGRILGDGQPKYLNSPQTEIFDKSGVLYGVHLAAETMRKANRAVLVEGYLDAVRAHLGGFASTVASLGTAVTPAQLTTLSRLAPTVVLALDPDPAGQAAAARTALTALAEVTKNRGRAEGQAGAVELRVAVLPADAGDPDELIRDDPRRWEETLDASIPAFDFYYDRTLQGLDRGDDAWRQAAIDRLLPVIQQFAESAGWQAKWIERLARDTAIDPHALQRSMPSGGRSNPARARSRPAAAGEVATATTARGLAADPALGVEEALLALLLRLVMVPAEAREELAELALERPEHQSLLAAILDWSETGNYEYDFLRETIPEDLHELADGLHGRNLPIPDDRRIPVAIAYHRARIDRFRLQAQLQRAGQTLADVDPDLRTEAVAGIGRLTSDLHEVERRLDDISRQMIQASTYA